MEVTASVIPRESQQSKAGEENDAARDGLPNTVRDAGAWVMFDGTPYAYLHICGTPWDGNEYVRGQVPIWTMRYGNPNEPAPK